MIRVHIFCEGQTEDTFVREVLRPHFDRLNIFVNPIILRTSKEGKGGVVSYGKVKHQVVQKCKQDSTAFVTTLIDYYALPADFPDFAKTADSIANVKAASAAIQADIGQANFIANLAAHEFEGLLFSAPEAFGEWFDDEDVVTELTKIRGQFATPEHINDGPQTVPSKRILKVCEDYDKVAHGSLIGLDIGLDAIRRECPLFNAWVEQLEALGVAA
ncbi:DUF4276 family protein [Nitrincola nitratireducens]|uniref:DUF4276 domain-containing protein n=1 Tax=Nitrincola nitratireducens TaxID=1229521 RepID=W9UPZ5_9GAMM|nr:DUF4276 family protein [Nitrincola nitratireducens]EXJ09179.1 hypothetical protein D791_03876 [Nitrincola nitratireducens]